MDTELSTGQTFLANLNLVIVIAVGVGVTVGIGMRNRVLLSEGLKFLTKMDIKTEGFPNSDSLKLKYHHKKILASIYFKAPHKKID